MLSDQTKQYRGGTMSHTNYITEGKKNKHITERERYTIEVLRKEGKTASEISQRLGRHVRTIERELKRGSIELRNSDWTYRYEYCADRAQAIYLENAKNKGPELKIGNDHKLANYIEDRILKDKYSPDAVIGEIKAKKIKFEKSICTRTLYNYIDKGVFANISNKDLPIKKDEKRIYRKVRIAKNNLRGTSIEERPKEIEERKEYGHWEMDCVVGKQGGSGAALLVLTERKIKEEIIIKLSRKTQEEVIKAIDRLEKRYGRRFKQKFKTITMDNGQEFLDFKALEGSKMYPGELRTKTYYAHPYSSWERGTNENSNRLIRRFIPKGTDIGGISKSEIKYIEKWMNNYPRRILGYKSPSDFAA